MALTAQQVTLWNANMTMTERDQSYLMRVANQDLIQSGATTWNVIHGTSLSTTTVNDAADITYGGLATTNTAITVNYDEIVPIIDYDTTQNGTTVQYLQRFAQDANLALINGLDSAAWAAAYAAAGSDFFEDGSSTAWQFTKDTCADIPAFFGKLDKAAKDLNWPEGKTRYIIGPSGFKEAIITYTGGKDSALGDNYLTSGLPNAFTYAGWTIMTSGLLTSAASVTHGIAGVVGEGIAAKTLIGAVPVESMRSEGRIGTLYRPRLRAAHKVYDSQFVIDINFNDTVVATS